MSASRPPMRRGQWIEHVFAIAVFVSLAWAMYRTWLYGYLPQPFFYEPQDLWMDWFNPAYWAHDKGVYDAWGTIYPPLTFVVLRVLGLPHCYVNTEGYPSRDCDWLGAVALHAIFVLNIFLVARTYLKIERRTALPRAFVLSAGLPMDYALERGNVVLMCFTCLVLAYGPLIKSARWRWVFAGATVNFKVYLVGALFAQLLVRRWRWFEGALIATVVIYLVTYAILGVGTPMEIYTNIADFSGLYQAINLLDLWYAESYGPVISLINAPNFVLTNMIGSNVTETAALVLPLVVRTVQATILAAAAAAWLRPEVVPRHRVTMLAIGLALSAAEAGGYTQMFVIFFVFFEPWQGIGRRVAIAAAYLLCLVWDIPIDRVPPLVRESYISGRTVIAEYSVGMGPFIRPGLILLMSFSLALVTMVDVWKDVRAGTSRTRRRFRHDTPLFPGDAFGSSDQHRPA